MTYCKELIHQARDNAVGDALPYEREKFDDLFRTEDQREGVNTFLEKRPPVWKNALLFNRLHALFFDKQDSCLNTFASGGAATEISGSRGGRRSRLSAGTDRRTGRRVEPYLSR